MYLSHCLLSNGRNSVLLVLKQLKRFSDGTEAGLERMSPGWVRTGSQVACVLVLEPDRSGMKPVSVLFSSFMLGKFLQTEFISL